MARLQHPWCPNSRGQITGDSTEHPYDTSKYVKPENPIVADLGGVKLAKTMRSICSLSCFPPWQTSSCATAALEEYEQAHAAERAAEEARRAAEEAAKPKMEPITGPVLAAPMGGTVIEIDVKPGDEIKLNQKVLVYEAMKMENDILAEQAGIVKRILVEPGQVVATGQPMIEFE